MMKKLRQSVEEVAVEEEGADRRLVVLKLLFGQFRLQ